MRVGEPFSYIIRIEGRGNTKRVKLPPLALGEGFKIYDVQEKSEFSPTGKSFKEIESLLIPQKAGVLRLPAFSFVYYNPYTAPPHYESQEVPELVFTSRRDFK